MSITVNNLTKNYGSQKAVDNISFAVNKGEIVGFLGPNGAGKSTTMKMITGYLEADGGDTAVCGIKVTAGSAETKRKIGYLPEANPLYFDMYVREYLEFIGHVHEVENAPLKVETVIETVGLKPEANKKIGQLSKGYKQRVGLAAALIHDPEVLILDEPTSGLDPNQIVEIREVIRRLGKDKTVLFSTHILQEVEAVCDRVIIINKGIIVANDTLSNLQQTGSTLQNIEVNFKERINIEWLKSIAGVEDVKNIPVRTDHPGGQNSIFNIKCSDAATVKKQILQLAIDRNLNIVSLQSEPAGSLEDIFRTLTTN